MNFVGSTEILRRSQILSHFSQMIPIDRTRKMPYIYNSKLKVYDELREYKERDTCSGNIWTSWGFNPRPSDC